MIQTYCSPPAAVGVISHLISYSNLQTDARAVHFPNICSDILYIIKIKISRWNSIEILWNFIKSHNIHSIMQCSSNYSQFKSSSHSPPEGDGSLLDWDKKLNNTHKKAWYNNCLLSMHNDALHPSLALRRSYYIMLIYFSFWQNAI